MNNSTSLFERVAFSSNTRATIRNGAIIYEESTGWSPRRVGRLKQYQFTKDQYVCRYIYLNEPTKEELKAAGVTCEEAFIFLRLLHLYRKVRVRSCEYRETVFYPILKEAQKQSPLCYREDYESNSIRVIEINSDFSYSTFTSTVEDFEHYYGGDAGLYLDMAVIGPSSPDFENNIARTFERKAAKSLQYWQLYFTLQKQLYGVVYSAFERYHPKLFVPSDEYLPIEQVIFNFCGFKFYIELEYIDPKLPRTPKIVWSDIDPYMECETR